MQRRTFLQLFAAIAVGSGIRTSDFLSIADGEVESLLPPQRLEPRLLINAVFISDKPCMVSVLGDQGRVLLAVALPAANYKLYHDTFMGSLHPTNIGYGERLTLSVDKAWNPDANVIAVVKSVDQSESGTIRSLSSLHDALERGIYSDILTT